MTEKQIEKLLCPVWPWSLNMRQLAVTLFMSNDLSLDEAEDAAKQILEVQRDRE